MPSDTVAELFSQLAQTELPVPDRDGVISRGGQRRRQTRTLTVVVVIATLLGTAGVVQRVTAEHVPPAVAQGHHKTLRGPQRPMAFGSRVLGVNRAGQFFVASAADLAGAVRVTWLPDARGFPPLIGTGPDGWVISYAVGPPGAARSPEQLAIVRASGVAMPFGPVFRGREYLTSLAVRPDGSAVAVGVAYRGRKPPPARIELIPMPGRHSPISTWQFTSTQVTGVVSLSWTTDGSRLTYAPEFAEGGSVAPVGAVIMQINGPGRYAIAQSRWPQGFQNGCLFIAGTWSGRHYLAMVVCDMLGDAVSPADPVTGALHYPVTPVPNANSSCGTWATVTAAPQGHALISSCELYAYNGKRVRRLGGPMVLAAYEGG